MDSSVWTEIQMFLNVLTSVVVLAALMNLASKYGFLAVVISLWKVSQPTDQEVVGRILMGDG